MCFFYVNNFFRNLICMHLSFVCVSRKYVFINMYAYVCNLGCVVQCICVFFYVSASLHRISPLLKQQKTRNSNVCNKSALSSSSWPPMNTSTCPTHSFPPIPTQETPLFTGPPPLPGSLPAHIPLAGVIVQSVYSLKTNGSPDSKRSLVMNKNIVFSQTFLHYYQFSSFTFIIFFLCWPGLFLPNKQMHYCPPVIISTLILRIHVLSMILV